MQYEGLDMQALAFNIINPYNSYSPIILPKSQQPSSEIARNSYQTLTNEPNIENYIMNLNGWQCNESSAISKTEIYTNNIGLFIEALSNPEINLTELSQAPIFNDFTLDDLFEVAIEQQIPSSRISWVVCTMFQQSQDNKLHTNITVDNIFQSISKFMTPEYSKKAHFICQLCDSLINCGMLRKYEVIPAFIGAFGFNENARLFKDGIINCFSILKEIFFDEKIDIFIQKNYDELITKHNQLISLASNFYYDHEKDQLSKVNSLMTEETIKRTRRIIEQITDTPPLQIIALKYEQEDDTASKTFRESVDMFLMLLFDDEIEDFIIQLCSYVFLLKEANFLLAEDIVTIILEKNINFPLKKYIKLLVANSEKIELSVELTAALQWGKVFTYEEFYHQLMKYCKNDKIILFSPCLSRKGKTLSVISNNVNRIVGGNHFDSLLRKIFTDICSVDIEEVKQLPFVLLFMVGLWLAQESKVDNVINILNSIGLNSIVRKVFPETKVDFQFSKEKVVSFFRERSYLCSLQVFDALHGVSSFEDFKQICKSLMKDLLSFRGVYAEDISVFLYDLANSGFVANPRSFISSLLIDALMENLSVTKSERIIAMIEPIFRNLIIWKVLKPYDLVSCIVEHQSNDIDMILFNTLFAMVENNPDDFSSKDFLTKEFFEVIRDTVDEERLNRIVCIISKLKPELLPAEAEKELLDINTAGRSILTYSSYIYSTLPSEMVSIDAAETFDFFKRNISWQTVKFWSSWLTCKNYFATKKNLFVTEIPCKVVIDCNNNAVIDFFYDNISAINESDIESERTKIICYAWCVINENNETANRAVEKITYRISDGFIPFPLLQEFVLPPLKNQNLNESSVENFYNNLMEFRPPEEHLELYIKTFIKCVTIYAEYRRNDQKSVSSVASFIDAIFQMLNRASDRLNKREDVSFYSDSINFVLSLYPNSYIQQRVKQHISEMNKICPRICSNISLGLPLEDPTPVKPVYYKYMNTSMMYQNDFQSDRIDSGLSFLDDDSNFIF